MSTDFRALCAELAQVLAEEYGVQGDFDSGEPLLGSGFELLSRARAALAQPEPVGPTDEELLKMAAKELGYEFSPKWFLTGKNCPSLETDPYELLGFARAALARWGCPTIEPVPVSERLPGPEDCDSRGWCWYWHPGEECWEMVPAVTGTLDIWTHWLPHHALPLPTPTP